MNDFRPVIANVIAAMMEIEMETASTVTLVATKTAIVDTVARIMTTIVAVDMDRQNGIVHATPAVVILDGSFFFLFFSYFPPSRFTHLSNETPKVVLILIVGSLPNRLHWCSNGILLETKSTVSFLVR